MSHIELKDGQISFSSETIYSILYLNNDIPFHYKEFFKRDKVIKIIQQLSGEIDQAAKTNTIYPCIGKVFRCLYGLKPPSVVILGQDPYHDGNACGLAFSVENSCRLNPSLLNIQKEVKRQGFNIGEKCGDLSCWARQGVLLLNTALTVEKSDPGSHTVFWVAFTEELLNYITTEFNPVYILWGKDAQAFRTEKMSNVLMTSHPSPFSFSRTSGGNPSFKDSNTFIDCNKILSLLGKPVIDWSIV